MKKVFSVLLALTLCLSALTFFAAAEETQPEPVITELTLSGLGAPLLGAGPFKMPSPEGGKQSNAVVYAAYGTPVIDGEIDEIWSSAVPEKYGTDKNDPESHVEAGRFRVLWDADYIYILFEINDTTLMPDDLARKDTNWYARDMICVTFNSTGSHEETEDIMPPAFWYGYRPCAVTPNFQRVPANVFFCELEGASATGYQNFTNYPADQRMAICKYTETGYIVEAKINLAARDETFSAYAGKRISFDTWVYGNDYSAERTEAVADHIYPVL